MIEKEQSMNGQKSISAIAFIWLSSIFFLNAQQPESPLIESFQEFQNLKSTTTYNLEWIQLGPTINSARVEAVQVDPTNPSTKYVAFGSGNLWKTVNNGLTWAPIFEDQPSLGIGDIALAPSDPNIIYVGTGESLKKPRNFTMPGTGVYKSEDAGKSWQNIGLEDSWHIGELIVHPTNPDIVFVAVLGHFWSTNRNRGVYRTLDGGKTWEKVLYVDEKTGANDIVMAPSDPNVLYASMWENNPGINGRKSNIYGSKDGGKTWQKLDNGIPDSEGKGRIGLAVSASNPDKVYAFMDHREKGSDKGAAEVYQSTNGGAIWKKTHDEELMSLSVVGWYFTDIYVNPKDDDEIFALGVRLAHSTDGGKTFHYIGGDVYHLFPSAANDLHLDHCELWINPQNPNHLALGNDGGFYESYDKGLNWTHFNNIPTGEFYDISLDYSDPYLIYGGTQDDATVYGEAKEWNPNFYDQWQYLWLDPWSGGDGCMTVIDPEDPNTLYFSAQEGAVRRMDLSTSKVTSLRPSISGLPQPLQFNFISPYFLSPHDHQTLYLAGNFVLRSTNRGDNWEVISPNLSFSEDPDKASLAAGAIAESPLKKGLLYTGMDKGAFWISQDNGANWLDISNTLPNSYIRCITPSKYKESRVYLSLSGMNYDDLNTYLYKSEDYGQTWKSLSTNLPHEVAYVIKEDPLFENILYAGLYRGAYISLNGGRSWSVLGKNLPVTSIADIEIDEKTMDLVVGTHGRGMYTINLKPIHEAQKKQVTEDFLFEIPSAKVPPYNGNMGGRDYRSLQKVPITFWAKQAGEVQLQVVKEDQVLWSTRLNASTGFNQFRWNLVRRRVASPLPYYIHFDEFIEPGEYEVELQIGSKALKNKLKVF